MILLGTFAGGQIVVLLIFLLLIVFMIWRIIKYYNYKSKQGKLKGSLLKTIGVLLIVIVGVTLPFHYVIEEGSAFPKANLTFKNTFITSSDVKAIIKRYNQASFMEKMQIRKDPFIETLFEKGILTESTNSNSDF
ncbi:hypothetical protein [Brumimicrobium oceani]|uniref:Uncharacterized protein n=1 Tax=Brumimicrobium oceani TaxID=2100725 RepID=A0A2U2XBQ6_9FLAO|nr:hypothetical protein [Brumimicrobium oceani]PWH85239.1 hypothetical protein DIT68_09885 [Brumimicrobium oceani]